MTITEDFIEELAQMLKPEALEALANQLIHYADDDTLIKAYWDNEEAKHQRWVDEQMRQQQHDLAGGWNV